jgi:hypothetical protein
MNMVLEYTTRVQRVAAIERELLLLREELLTITDTAEGDHLREAAYHMQEAWRALVVWTARAQDD